MPAAFSSSAPICRNALRERRTTLGVNPWSLSTAQSVGWAVAMTTSNDASLGCWWERPLVALAPQCPGGEQVSEVGNAAGEWFVLMLPAPSSAPLCSSGKAGKERVWFWKGGREERGRGREGKDTEREGREGGKNGRGWEGGSQGVERGGKRADGQRRI